MASTVVNNALDTLNKNLAASSGSKNSATTSSALQERFLTMLVSQLKNQDPLNPMDNAQVTSQLAQINTVSGVSGVNDTLKTLLDSFQGMQTLQGASLIGRTVWAESGDATLKSGESVPLKLSLSGPADKAAINILDQNGKTVRTIDVGAQKSGTVDVTWDGKDNAGNTLPAGSYTLQVNASLEGKTVTGTTQVQGVVKSVAQDGTGLTLSIDGIKNSLKLNQIRQVL